MYIANIYSKYWDEKLTMKRLFLSLNLLLISFAAHAGSVEFTLLNPVGISSPSTPPINVTAGYIEYYFFVYGDNTSIPTYCPTGFNPAHINLSSIVTMPFSIPKENSFTFNLPSNLTDCIQKNGAAYIALNVTQMDGIIKQKNPCIAYTYMYSPNDTLFSTMSITESVTDTGSNFYCTPASY